MDTVKHNAVMSVQVLSISPNLNVMITNASMNARAKVILMDTVKHNAVTKVTKKRSLETKNRRKLITYNNLYRLV
jgi:hypothetical protein